MPEHGSRVKLVWGDWGKYIQNEIHVECPGPLEAAAIISTRKRSEDDSHCGTRKYST